LWTKEIYSDFILDLEYKHPKEGNSGVFFRVGNVKDPVETGIEVQILDSHGKPEALSHHDCGGVIRTVGPSKNMAKPAGEWNRMVVTCRGSQLQVELNGEEIVDVDLANTDSRNRPAEGHIGLQDHGQPLEFRNVRVKRLDGIASGDTQGESHLTAHFFEQTVGIPPADLQSFPALRLQKRHYGP